MGRHQNFYQPQPSQTRSGERQIHPIWRGVGLLFLIIIPAVSFIITLVLLDANTTSGWIPIPNELISPWLDPLLFIKIIMTVITALVLYAFFTLITFAAYRLFGPERYGPLDAPPIKARVTKRTR